MSIFIDRTAARGTASRPLKPPRAKAKVTITGTIDPTAIDERTDAVLVHSVKDASALGEALSRGKRVVSLQLTSLWHLQSLELPPMPALKWLQVADCMQLAELRGIERAPGLRTLLVSMTVLSALPDELAALTALEHLKVSASQLEIVPPAIATLRSLRVLTISGARVRALPVLDGLVSLQDLDLGGVRLDADGAIDGIGSVTSLENLRIARCGVREVPPALARLARLRELDLHGNPLTTLPAELASLRALEAIDLSQTQLREVPAVLAKWPSLREAWLEGTPVTNDDARAFTKRHDLTTHIYTSA